MASSLLASTYSLKWTVTYEVCLFLSFLYWVAYRTIWLWPKCLIEGFRIKFWHVVICQTTDVILRLLLMFSLMLTLSVCLSRVFWLAACNLQMVIQNFYFCTLELRLPVSACVSQLCHIIGDRFVLWTIISYSMKLNTLAWYICIIRTFLCYFECFLWNLAVYVSVLYKTFDHVTFCHSSSDLILLILHAVNVYLQHLLLSFFHAWATEPLSYIDTPFFFVYFHF